MASIVDEAGVQVRPEAEMVLTREQCSRTRDMIIIRLRAVGTTFPDIGRIMNARADTISGRYYNIPAEVREHYGSITLV